MRYSLLCLVAAILSFIPSPSLHAETANKFSYIPPFLTNAMPPYVMLTMARDHRLYYEAYNDASDINGDGVLDVRYNPSIEYYGYFDSYKYYEFNSTSDRFEPRGTTANKKSPAGNYWSGDFLNYVSMTRMDCLRKVLYGGWRSTDTPTATVLERAYIPQDAHSFGKEYNSIANDGYDIREYTPLNLPVSGTRHLIATTALGNDGKPLLRVLNDTTARIWEWVATESPVVKSSMGGTTGHPGHPSDHAGFDTMVATYATESRKFGNATANIAINDSGNPFGDDDNYLTVFSGTITIAVPGTYYFAIDGDDAVELLIDGNLVVGFYGGHGACGCTSYYNTVNLSAGTHTVEFRHEEATGGDSYKLMWRKPGDSSYSVVPAYTAMAPYGLSSITHATYRLVTDSVITDYTLRVQVGVSGMPEQNCKMYPNGAYKPIGLLQRHGESDRMLFGLLTGSYTKNISGGVLRKPISSIKNEINENTGEFLYQDNSTVGGIVKTLDKFRIHGFDNGGGFSYNENCGWIATTPLAEGQCRMWGSPMAEMMYETVRYFMGASAATPEFVYSSSDSSADDNQLGLPLATWNNPYNSTNYCSKPIMIAISDIFPSYDSDQLPGSYWPATLSTTISGLNVDNGVQSIANSEGINGTFFIGQSGALNDYACTPKAVPGLEGLRGLCPEEPSKKGAYYSAAVTHFAATHDLHSATSNQTMASYMVALSSPLPEIRIPVAGKIVTMVPFAKSVGGYGISSANGDFQPTNTIVDFFVEDISPTNGTFRVNFEDVEQGADHDMDAIVRFHYDVVGNATVNITVSSEYASGSIIQHMGYIISGTTSDGTYLVVRDTDTSAGSDPDYYLDVPNVAGALPLYDSRSFTPGVSSAASLLKNPLWYAAKWGGFEDTNDNGIPDLQAEWDKNNDGVPDTYFYVANPTRLEEQLNQAFSDILRRTASGTAASVISQSREGEGAIYQSIFFPEFKDSDGNTITWAGQAHALFVDSRGNIREDTNHNYKLDVDDTNNASNTNDKIIIYDDTYAYRYQDLNGDLDLSSAEKNATVELLGGPQEISFLWSSSSWLNSLDDADAVAQRSFYNATTSNRYIFTFADKNNDMIVESGEIQDFVWPPAPTPNAFLNNSTDYYAYLTLYPSFADTPSEIATLRSSNSTGFAALLNTLAQRQVDFIRGEDQPSVNIAGYPVNATRSRTYSDNSTLKTWRLGDIVYSTPTVVGKPAENYHLIYFDDSYAEFYKKYLNRRQMIYVGGNDGMLHAFNGGFYNSTNAAFQLTRGSEVEFPLGMEVWGYIPYNLLPHLAWLLDPTYGSQLHVSYMDLKPRIFDAKIFFQADGVTPLDADHPGGWGTVLVAGMRLGGGKIQADLDKTDGNAVTASDRVMSSAYVLMDITNPEIEPRVLTEIKMPGMGFSTSFPTAMPMSTKNGNATAANEWYLVFGSGPANSAGEADAAKLGTATSDQNGRLFVLDLKALAVDNQLRSLNSTGDFQNGLTYFAKTEAGSFVSDPVALDLDLGSSNSTAQFKADAVYYGTVSGDQTSPKGTLRRLVTNNAMPVGNHVAWSGNSTLANVLKPVTAAPAIAMDDSKRLWVYFGAGRFFDRDDIPQTYGMTFYGIKEPGVYNSSQGKWNYSWGQITVSDLYNSTQISLGNGTCTTDFNEYCVAVYKNASLLAGGWAQLLSEVAVKPGWELDLSHSWERVVGQASVLGGTVLFTGYTPSNDLCAIEGSSNLWAVYYKTGTPYFDPIFSGIADTFASHISLGRGLAATPNLHVGDSSQSNAFIQSSTGAIQTIKLTNPLNIKSGSIFWQHR